MLVRDRPAGFTVTVTASISQITLGITGTAGTGEYALIDQPLVGPQPLPSAPTPTIVASASGPRYYAIRDNSTGATNLYLVFSDFTFALDHLMTSGAVLDQISAVGVYTGASNTIAAQLAMVVVN
jgi:hypothetical protein